MSVENKHLVPKNWWDKLTPQAQRVFNDVYEDITKIGPDLFLHPDTRAMYTMSVVEFNTIAWNAAWTASKMVAHPGSSKTLVTVQEGSEEPATGAEVLAQGQQRAEGYEDEKIARRKDIPHDV